MPFLLAEILNFQGSTHRIGVGSFSKITLLRMKKICWKLKKEKAFDEATSISLNTKGAGEKYALNMLVEKNIVIKTETGKVYLK